MACYKQRRVHRKAGGGIQWDPGPASLLKHDEYPLRVNCGNCIGCRVEKTASWATRSIHEAQMHEENSFITLTYSDEALPKDRSVVYDHWQKFAKKVRNHCGPFRFLMSGEYSPAPELRPHYHALIFGHDWHNERVPLETKKGGHQLWISPILARLWKHGHHSIGTLNYQTAAYVAKYCLKKLSGKYAERENDRVDPLTGEWWTVAPEFQCMSRNPGLGAKWIDQYVSDVYPSDECIVDGKRLKPPKYYDERVKRTDPERIEKVEEARRKHIKEHGERNTDEQLEIREEIAKARIALGEK